MSSKLLKPDRRKDLKQLFHARTVGCDLADSNWPLSWMLC